MPQTYFKNKKSLHFDFHHHSERLSSFGRASTPGQTQTGLEPKVFLLLPQAVVLLGSDAGSDVIKSASSFVIQNYQTFCFVCCLMYRARY